MLSKKVEKQENLKFDIMNNDFCKPYVSPVHITTEYQNAEEVKTDFVSDEEEAAELGPDIRHVLNFHVLCISCIRD